MRPSPRRPTALLALLAMASALFGLLGAHAHAFGEVDRVAHSLIAIDHPASAAHAPHLDRARELEHRACGDCLLASIKSDGVLQAAATQAPAPSKLALAVSEPVVPRRPHGCRAPARAPPLA